MTLSPDQLDRYARHIVLKEIGGPGQQKLLKARVLIVGAGGLGNPCALYLAAAGVGTIGLVDDDAVALSNLQRQILFRTDDVGKQKVMAARAAIGQLNPDVHVNAHATRLSSANAETLVREYDIVADGCDNFETRFAVSDACLGLRKTLVSAAVQRFEAQVATFKPHLKNADGEPLPCYRCLVPEAPPRRLAAVCAEVGIIGALTGVAGSLQALEVIKEITGAGDTLAGRLLLYDALSADFRTIRLRRDPSCLACAATR
ncbi:MAG: molybdopterin-synthase adenylyltransferase MoeB [Alphaproteobacteria bacterium]